MRRSSRGWAGWIRSCWRRSATGVLRLKTYALLLGACFVLGLDHHGPDIFDRVMLVHLQVTYRFDAQVKKAVTRECIEQVIEERNSGVDLGHAAAVQTNFDLDIGFARLAGDASLSVGFHTHGSLLIIVI